MGPVGDDRAPARRLLISRPPSIAEAAFLSAGQNQEAVHAPGARDPHPELPVVAGGRPARDIMEEPELFKVPEGPAKRKKPPKEYKVVALRDCPLPEHLLKCDTPEHAADYWRRIISTLPSYDPDKESFVVLLLTTRRHVKGHHLVATGTLNQVTVHAREVFRAAIVAAAHAVVLMHNFCAAAHKLCYVKRRIM